MSSPLKHPTFPVLFAFVGVGVVVVALSMQKGTAARRVKRSPRGGNPGPRVIRRFSDGLGPDPHPFQGCGNLIRIRADQYPPDQIRRIGGSGSTRSMP